MVRPFAVAALLSCLARELTTTLTVAREYLTFILGRGTRGFVVACALACLTGAASAQAQPVGAAGRPTPGARTEAKPAGKAEIGRCEIGVIAVGGNLFTIEKFGSFAPNDLHKRAGADGWGFDDLIVSRVRAAAPGAVVRKIAYSREELAQARDAPPIFRIANSNLKDFVRQVSAGANCDRYVMVHRSGGKSVFGIGIAKFTASLVNRTYLYALMYVRVYDGQTFELIKDGPALVDDEPFLSRAFNDPIGGPYRVVDDRLFPASREEAVANPTLREGVRLADGEPRQDASGHA
jgi:hypothetical protein